MPRIAIASLFLIVLVACAGPQPSASRLFVASNDHRVYGLGEPDRFEVLSRPGAAGRDYFCAASEYAIRRLRAGPTDRLVVATPIGGSLAQPSRRAVGFQLVPQGVAVPDRRGVTVSVSRVGENLNVAHGRSFCRDELDNGFFFAFSPGRSGAAFGASFGL